MKVFYGKYATMRKFLDYTFHKIYTKERQLLQDQIITLFLEGSSCYSFQHLENEVHAFPLFILTAGAMGAGKSHVIKKLLGQDYSKFVIADVDHIKHCLPEMSEILAKDPFNTGHLLHSEACTIHELLMRQTIYDGKNIIVDGSLQNGLFFYDFITKTELAKKYEIHLYHIVASMKKCIERAHKRSLETGRIVPKASIELSLIKCPKSVEMLKPIVHKVIVIDNEKDEE